ncbi:Retrovirus-related Pol polyprotein from transposon TNT 1-94 [Araneus ventricosus]|uniref:Retrovirus-related Pol polyprotein from transposon TNT 1-94 n=1 Tax=Araneus ventricosus TaxID=182803 RepID=A0A4Y2MNS7_ARAVE|nr:Retrovirus-related Pol polyprotein from transposon TNT 1-94 [Araneus ventricosus]GBN28158.1 Retrovirus-related Pol polyprotein from transposon TNT 1-94 [Araneus ventricosus]GBN28192.1 Retrovirus-related Pol polyprotein from transposon TNT 1-94 [Araneus ventricosus]
MDRISVPALTGTNYFIWSLKMQAALSLKRLDSVTTQMKPEGLSEKDASEWQQKNSDAVAYIKLSFSDEQALQFAAENNAKILWDKIKSTFTGQTEDRKIDAGNELKNLQINSNELANDYIARARGIATKCHSLGLNVSPRELVYYTVRGLKGKFAKVRDILKTQRDKSIDEVLEILREEETSFNLPSSTRAEGRSADVFYSRKSKNSGMRLCYVCRRPNHVAKDCFYRNQKESTTTSRRRKVHRNNNSKERNAANPVFTASPNEESLCENIWILDSGASCHMAKDSVWFEKILPERKDIYLAGKDLKIICEGFGTVKAKTVSTKYGNPLNITIENVSYVPQLRCNLLSVICLMDKGYKIKSDNNCVLIYDKSNKLVTKAFKNNGRLELYFEPLYNSECYFSNPSNSNYDIWHSRLCHLNAKYMLKMKDYIDIDDVNDFKCETCDISKITRKTHPNIDVNQSSEILELIHADLCGPIQPESYGGAKYFMVLVDDFSGMYFTYFLKNKNEVFDIFSQFKAKYENLTDKRIKKLRTDNGLEFVNEQLDTYLANSDIFHEKTIPYNSGSNGKAERANRILLERARSLLYESELPLKFWAEVINFSTQVSNVTPRKGKEKIPLETWIGKKPKLNYLKKFGCVAYFHVPKVMRNKFDVPGRRGIMLGYARDRRGYRIYDIENRKIIEERSIKFNESLKGSTYLGKTKVETWNIDSLFESTQDINEFGHKTKVNHLEISAEPAANENNYSIPFETPDDATNTVGGEIETLVDQIPVRRSERLKAKQMSTNLACNVPNSYLEAKKSADWQNWEFAMKNELDSLNKHKVWKIVDRPAKTKLVKSKWVYSLKQSDNGETKYKARLVAAGSNQIKNKDYLESYSPVVNIESFRLLITLASKLNLMVRFFDVKTAYLYSDIEETVYMLPPPGFERLVGDEKVCKLKRSSYGLPQSGKNWYMKIKSELEKFGLTQLASDNCVFIKSDGQNMLLLCMHVDDLAIFCNNDEMYQDIVNSIKSVFEEHENKTSKFLGMEIVKHKNGISLSQSEYIESLLVKYNLNECKSVKTPIVKGEDKSFPPTNELIDITMYQELIGELLYLANRTRPDISFVTCYLSQFNHKPEKRHYILAKRVLRYLMGTKDKKLFYDNNFGFVNASSDASWRNAENGKSFSGGVILLGNSLISWKCHKQKSVSLSTCEAELFAISEICKDIIWIVNLLSELKCKQFINSTVILNSDSQAAIQWIKGIRSSNKSRHMNLRFHFVKDLSEDNVIELKYIQTELLIADFLTKAVNEEKLNYTVKNISLTS